MDELLPAIGHRLRAARAFLGLSQEDVAARAQLNTCCAPPGSPLFSQ